MSPPWSRGRGYGCLARSTVPSAFALPSYDGSLGHHGSVRTSPTRFSEEEFINDADYSVSLEHAWVLLLSFRTHPTDGLVSLRSVSFCVAGAGCAQVHMNTHPRSPHGAARSGHCANGPVAPLSRSPSWVTNHRVLKTGVMVRVLTAWAPMVSILSVWNTRAPDVLTASDSCMWRPGPAGPSSPTQPASPPCLITTGSFLQDSKPLAEVCVNALWSACRWCNEAVAFMTFALTNSVRSSYSACGAG